MRISVRHPVYYTKRTSYYVCRDMNILLYGIDVEDSQVFIDTIIILLLFSLAIGVQKNDIIFRNFSYRISNC